MTSTGRRGRSPEDIERLLRQAISGGVLPPGHRLVHEELADRFGVSRIPLREALRTLASEGLVRIEPGRGTFVTELDLDEIDEIYELRRLVEPSFAVPVVMRAGPADIDRLHDMATRMDGKDAMPADDWSRLNFAFHLDMYRLAGRPMTYAVMSRLYHQLEPYSRFYVHATHSHDRVQHEHHAMIGALRDRRAEELERSIVEHIEGGREGLTRAWRERQPAAPDAFTIRDLEGRK